MSIEIRKHSDFTEVERLLRLDIDDAFISEMVARHLQIAADEIEITIIPHDARGLIAIRRALIFRFMIVVQRLLRGESGRKATLLALLSAARSHVDQAKYDAFQSKLTCIRDS
jgi:hypothetical protein